MTGQSSSLPICGAARAYDVAALDVLWASAFDAPARQRTDWMRNLRRVRVVRVDGALRAACVLSPLRLVVPGGELRLVWLRALAVEPLWRGRGLASLLLAHARAIAARNARALALRSQTRELYERAGMRVSGEVRGLLLQRGDLPEPGLRPLGGVVARDVRATAALCARATGLAVPLPGPRLSALLLRRGSGLAAAEGAACGLAAREGSPWCAAGDARSALSWLSSAASRMGGDQLRIDAWLPGIESLPRNATRSLGPWWIDAPMPHGDLPASVLACLD